MNEFLGKNNHVLENQLIIDASQTRNTSGKVDQISKILKQSLDWQYILKIVEQNSVLPLFCWNLLQNFSHLLSKQVFDELNYHLQIHTHRNMTLTKRLVDVLRLFESKNIPIISFKGPLLAIQAYRNLALRKFNDLDILVHPKHLDEAIDLLNSAGFVPHSSLRWFERKDWYLSRKKDVIFVDKNSEYILELHWKLSGAHFAFPLEIEKIWENIQTTKLAGIDVNILSFNDLFLYLCLHGARHSWERLSWICDVNELIHSESEIDWEQINQEAKRFGCENILGLGLFLVNKFYGTKVKVSNWDKIENNQTFKEITNQIEKRLFDENAVNLDINERYAYHLKLKEKKWDKLKLHLHYQLWYLQLLIYPNRQDRETFNLPKWISPIYFVMRPVRLIYTHLTKSRKS